MGVPHSDAAILGLPAGPIPKGDALAGVSDMTLSATLTITMGHDTKLSVPFAGFGALDAHPSNAVQPLGKSALVLHLDDSTAPVSAPTNVSAFDIGALLNQLSRQFGGVGAAATLNSCPGAAAPAVPSSSGSGGGGSGSRAGDPCGRTADDRSGIGAASSRPGARLVHTFAGHQLPVGGHRPSLPGPRARVRRRLALSG